MAMNFLLVVYSKGPNGDAREVAVALARDRESAISVADDTVKKGWLDGSVPVSHVVVYHKVAGAYVVDITVA
jgi:hypothetical protein